MRNCPKCGNQIYDNGQFCGVCGFNLDRGDTYGYANRNNNTLVIVAVIAAVILLIVAVFAVVMLSEPKGSDLLLTVNTVSEQATSPYYTLSGTAKTEKYMATIYVNGETAEAVKKSKTEKIWYYDVILTKGENTFVVTIEDEKGQSVSKTTVINYNSNPFPKGTYLVKSVKEGIYVRPYASKGDEYVLYIDRKDYYTHLLYLDETTVGADGYDWHKVQTPNNGIGWVRCDIVEPVN